MSYFKANRNSQTFNCCLLRQKKHEGYKLYSVVLNLQGFLVHNSPKHKFSHDLFILKSHLKNNKHFFKNNPSTHSSQLAQSYEKNGL